MGLFRRKKNRAKELDATFARLAGELRQVESQEDHKKRQRKIIESCEQIIDTTKEIEEQKTKIEQQYEEAMYRNASAMATESLELAEEGYVDDAVKMSLLAVTGTEEEPMPSNADALNALASNLRAYRIGIVSEPSKVFEMGAESERSIGNNGNE